MSDDSVDHGLLKVPTLALMSVTPNNIVLRLIQYLPFMLLIDVSSFNVNVLLDFINVLMLLFIG